MKIPTWVYVLIIVVFIITRPYNTRQNRQQFWSSVFSREGMVNKTCPDGTRSDGPCLLEFPTS